MILVRLAIADLWHDRIMALCNVAAIIGIVAPLGILTGIKTGVVDALIHDLVTRPDILRVAISGDHGFTPGDIEEVADWQETGFVVPSSRSIARRLMVRREGGTVIRRAALVATGAGEPWLADSVVIARGEVAASSALARRLALVPGDRLEAVARRGETGETVLRLTLKVAALLPRGTLAGDGLLMTPALMDDIEAFYDGYAVTHLGMDEGRPLSGRTALAESMRLYASDLHSVAPLEARLETRFGIEATSDAAEVRATLDLERRLGLALDLIVAAATAGLFAALTASFWSMTRARRRALAVLAMIGMPPVRLACYPVWVALVTALFGLAGTAGLVLVGAVIATRLFGGDLPGDASFMPSPGDAARLSAGVLVVSAAAAFLAAREAARAQPGAVFREEA
ncbi:MAG: ABC transporter permease [Alphaproteobacteria bacterium]|nr:ABC transporter permease [Alphaproteobacteria bacterium]MCY4607848.1 ABC transporter permease [bacterium]